MPGPGLLVGMGAWRVLGPWTLAPAQGVTHEWDGVIAEVAAALRERAG